MMFIVACTSLLWLSYATASISFHRTGWLDRVVQYRKNEFFKDVQNLPPIQIKATIKTAPPGYVDSPEWDYDSVNRLMTLIRESEKSRDVYRVLRRALSPSRRAMSWQKTFKYFPRLKHVVQANDIYYDVSSGENATESWENDEGNGPITNTSIVFVSNPVEAKLPSAQISVGMLRQILWNRAEAARIMPTTEKTPIPWKPMNKTTTVASSDGPASNDTSGNVTTTAADGDSTAAEGGTTDSGATENADGTAAEGEATTAAAEEPAAEK